jgi:hypothetical protein
MYDVDQGVVRAWIRKSIMTGENFEKNILFQNRGHVLTLFFNTCLADDEARKIADGSGAILLMWCHNRWSRIGAHGLNHRVIM